MQFVGTGEEEHVRTIDELTDEIDRWLDEHDIAFVAQDDMRGFVYDDVQVSVDVGVEADLGFVLVGAIVLTVPGLTSGLAREDIQACLQGLAEAWPPVVLAIGAPDHTIWACEGFELDEFNVSELSEVVEEVTAHARAIGPELQTLLSGGILGTEARVKGCETPAAGGRSDVRERRARQRQLDFERLLEYSLRVPRGSLRVTSSDPYATHD